jgi:hypothetical protein
MSEKNKFDGVSSSKTYIGPVVDNNDPEKIGRVRVKVMDVFDGLKDEEIPWASPWKDLNGNQFNIPDKGKVVTVIFENGNKNNPEYISSDHYNENLENKLKQLSKSDYSSMKSLLYDHKTQIYVNDSEGLKLDHKFNNINIKEDSINLNLKDNNGWINIGTQNSNQRAILGDNFTNWFDEFLDILIGKSGGFALGNLATPVQASPALITHIQKYFSIKTSKILSQHVKIVDNDYVDTQKRTENVSEGVKGDKWASTVEDNKLTTKEEVKFKPVEGPSNATFDKPPVDSKTPVPKEDLKPSTTPTVDTPTVTQTVTPISSTPSVPTETGPVVEGERNPDVDVLIQLLKNKNYKIYDRPYEINIVAIRNQCLSKGQNYTNDFCDDIYIFYADELKRWHIKKYKYSTMPGSEFTLTENWLKEQKLSEPENEYWKTKINKKITLKEFYKGPPKNNSTVTPSNESLLNKKDELKEVTGLSSNNSVFNNLGLGNTSNLKTSSDGLGIPGLSSNNSALNNLSIGNITNISGLKDVNGLTSKSILSPLENSSTSELKNSFNKNTEINTDLKKIPNIKELSDLNNDLPPISKTENGYIIFGRSYEKKDPSQSSLNEQNLKAFKNLRQSSINNTNKDLSNLIGKKVDFTYSNTEVMEEKIYISADGANYISVVKVKWIDSEKTSENKDVKIMTKDEIIKYINLNNYGKEIASKDIKSFNQEKFIVSNSISKTKSAANLSAMDMTNKYVVDNKVSGLSTDYTTYLKENNGNIDYLHIKPLEK